jgi:hypothetical protein
MGIHVRCPACAAEYELAEHLAGKKVHCEKCQAVISVAGDDAPPPRRPGADALRAAEPPRREGARGGSERPARRDRDRDEDDDDRPPRKKGGGLALGLILGGVGVLVLVLLLVCVGVGGAALWLFQARSMSSPVAMPAKVAMPAEAPQIDPGPPPDPKPEPKPAPKPGPDLDPDKGPKVPPPDKPKDPRRDPPPWAVVPDPLPDGLTLADNPQGSIPITAKRPLPNNVVDQVVYPTSPSPFVSVAVKGNIFDAHEVWDLRTMKSVGVVPLKHPFTIASLSPDGAWFAVPSWALDETKGADAYAVADGRLSRIVVNQDSRTVENIDFAGPDRAVTIEGVGAPDGPHLAAKVWKIKTHAFECVFGAPASPDPAQRAFSPGRRYIALATSDKKRIQLYALSGDTQGALVGEAPLPVAGACLGLAFSPDGKSLAGLFKTGAATHLVVWDLATGKATAHHTFDKDPVENVAAFRGPAIDFLPKGGGWLLYGQALVDDQSGAVYWRIPVDGAEGAYPRRIYGDGVLASVKSDGGKRALVFEPLPTDKIAEALKAARAGR